MIMKLSALLAFFLSVQANYALECLYVGGVMRMTPSESRKAEGVVLHRCLVLKQPGQWPEMVYDLPKTVLDRLNEDPQQQVLHSGVTWLTIPGATTVQSAIDGDVIVWNPTDNNKDNNSTNGVIGVTRDRSRDNSFLRQKSPTRNLRKFGSSRRRQERRRQQEFSSSLDVRTVVVVRILSRDGLEPFFSKNDLEENFFSTEDGVTSFANQYRLCSGGLVQMNPAFSRDDGEVSSSIGSQRGVVDLHVDADLMGIENMTTTLENLLTRTFEERFGTLSHFDHVLFCLPASTGFAWLAYTYPNTHRSYYNDKWCGFFSTPFHEVGHNLGLTHSGISSTASSNNVIDTYGDSSCLMGDSYPWIQSPGMCFNGHKFWVLGWFQNKQVSIDPAQDGPWTGHLVAFVDVTKIEPNNPTRVVLLRVGNLYILNNRAKDYNYETKGQRNMVTIVKANATDSISLLESAIDERSDQNTFTDNVLLEGGQLALTTVEVCHRQQEQQLDEQGSIDFYVMSVRLASQESTCVSRTPYPTTDSPTIPSPVTLKPITPVPTMAAPVIPTARTMQPTTPAPVTQAPSTPAPIPTTEPTVAKSDTPTLLPSVSPSRYTASPTTKEPTLAPSSELPTISVLSSEVPSSVPTMTVLPTAAAYSSLTPSVQPSSSSASRLGLVKNNETVAEPTAAPSSIEEHKTPRTATPPPAAKPSKTPVVAPGDCVVAGGFCRLDTDCCRELKCHGPHPAHRRCLEDVDRYYIRDQFWKLGH